MLAELKADFEALEEGGRRNSGPRRYLSRPREEANQRLMDDYFTENPLYNSKIFRRRFRMRRSLFLCIVDALGEWSPFFKLYDATNRPGLSPIQKCIAAIRQLGTGSTADEFDEYIKIGESTALECLNFFVKGVNEIFGAEYLRRPTVQDLEHLLEKSERDGFPGKIGSVDCMHWRWENVHMDGRVCIPVVIMVCLLSF
jgi:hypothetical protein